MTDGRTHTTPASSLFDDAAEKRIRRAVEMAKQAIEKPEMESIYLPRFHRAMDALQTRIEGEEVYDRCRRSGWYPLAAEALKSIEARQ